MMSNFANAWTLINENDGRVSHQPHSTTSTSPVIIGNDNNANLIETFTTTTISCPTFTQISETDSSITIVDNYEYYTKTTQYRSSTLRTQIQNFTQTTDPDFGQILSGPTATGTPTTTNSTLTPPHSATQTRDYSREIEE
jgi:hypothetical protein